MKINAGTTEMLHQFKYCMFKSCIVGERIVKRLIYDGFKPYLHL
jgi:hypothetical protein